MSDAMDRLMPRLANWRIWLRGGYGERYGQCDSIEGNHRGKGAKVLHPPGARPAEPREADAWDLTMAASTLPLRLHLCLKFKYVYEFQDRTIAEIFREDKVVLRCKARDIDAIDWEARCELLEALATPMVVRRARAVAKARQVIAKVQDMMVD